MSRIVCSLLLVSSLVLLHPETSLAQSSNVFGFFGRLGRNIPLVGTCDRIVYRGVVNCLANFGPSTMVRKGRCCAYRKYHACIEGLNTGLSVAMRLEQCPARSYSMTAIRGISDTVVGFPMSSCPKKGACKQARL